MNGVVSAVADVDEETGAGTADRVLQDGGQGVEAVGEAMQARQEGG